jgi:hypothetical protein
MAFVDTGALPEMQCVDSHAWPWYRHRTPSNSTQGSASEDVVNAGISPDELLAKVTAMTLDLLPDIIQESILRRFICSCGSPD